MSEEWSTTSLAACLEEVLTGEWGLAPSEGRSNARVLRSTNLDDAGHLDLNTAAERRVPQQCLTKKRLRHGDILLEASGGGPGRPVGRVARFSSQEASADHAYVGSNFMRTLRPIPQVSPDFIAWRLHRLHRDPAIHLFQQQTTGIINLKVAEYLKYEFELPPLPEQQRIAEILDTLDEAIRKTEQVIAKLQQVKQGLLHDLLTRGIDENGELRDPDRHPEQFKDSELGRIPVCWAVRDLSSWVREDAPITYGIVQAGPHFPNGVPYVRTGDMSGGRLEISQLLRTSPAIARSYARSTLRSGEIVFAIRASIGTVLPVPDELEGANLTQGTARVSPSPAIASRYLLWYLRSASVRRQIAAVQKGTTFQEITLEHLRALVVAAPSDVYEQECIAQTIEAAEAPEGAEIDALRKLRALKSALMHDLLTGRVRTIP